MMRYQGHFKHASEKAQHETAKQEDRTPEEASERNMTKRRSGGKHNIRQRPRRETEWAHGICFDWNCSTKRQWSWRTAHHNTKERQKDGQTRSEIQRCPYKKERQSKRPTDQQRQTGRQQCSNRKTILQTVTPQTSAGQEYTMKKMGRKRRAKNIKECPNPNPTLIKHPTPTPTKNDHLQKLTQQQTERVSIQTKI